MDETVANIVSTIPATTIIDYFGVVIGVIAGAMFAIERKLDVVGVISLGLVTGFGGGIIRDLLLQNQGIFFMEHPLVILVGICLSIVLSLAGHRFDRFFRHLPTVDAFTMAWFVLAGASKSWYAGAGEVISVILGVITAVGGGMLRSICVGEVPQVFQPGTYYAISSCAGAVFYVVPMTLGAPETVASILCVGVCFGLTLLSRRFNWRTHGGGHSDGDSGGDEGADSDGETDSCPDASDQGNAFPQA